MSSHDRPESAAPHVAPGPRSRWRRLVWRAALVGAVLMSAGAGVGALALSHDAACPPAPPTRSLTSDTMRALTYACYGSADVLRLDVVEKPRPAPGRLLVRVAAASVNPLDWHSLHGTPFVMRLESGIGRPRDPRMGADFSGVVEAIGDGVTGFAPGDAVFGASNGALAEYVTVRAAAVAHVPGGQPLDEAATIPVAGVTALQAVRDLARVRAGQRVLVNGASGGVGTFAVQIAKSLGAEVTGVSSTRNLELVRSLGAAHVIDYTRDDFTMGDRRYDVVIDAVGNRDLRDIRRVMTADGTCVLVGGGGPERSFLGPVAGLLTALAYDRVVSQQFLPFLAEVTPERLNALADLVRSGAVRPVIDRRYGFDEAAEAIRYLETGRARGKVLVTMASTDGAAPISR